MLMLVFSPDYTRFRIQEGKAPFKVLTCTHKCKTIGAMSDSELASSQSQFMQHTHAYMKSY